MRSRNPNLSKPLRQALGSASAGRTGSAGMVIRDASTTGVVDDLLFVGATFTDLRDGTGIITMGGSGGTGTGTPPWINVKDYGAVGDGTTLDCSAINDAIDDLNATSGGVLYFPPGTYLCNAGLNAITVPCLIRGEGPESATATVASGPISMIRCSHATASLFTINAAPVLFSQLALDNSNANPTAGAAITTTGGTVARFELLHITDFFTGIDIENSNLWTMRDCLITGVAKYGIRVRNTANPDAGDWSIVGTVISNADTGDAAIRVESSGGGKIVNCKISSANSTTGYNYGIEVTAGTGVSTSVLLITNTSIEHPRTDAIRVTTTGAGSYDLISIVGCQMGLYANTTGKAIDISAGTLLDIRNVTIDNILATATGGNSNAAVSLTNVENARIDAVVIDGFGSRLATSGCTNVIDATTGAGGAAGGDLSGTYPNPTVTDDSHAHTGSTISGVTGSADHAHIGQEEHTSDGSTTAFTLDNEYEPGTVVAFNLTDGTVMTVTETLPNVATLGAAQTAADVIAFNYAARLS